MIVYTDTLTGSDFQRALNVTGLSRRSVYLDTDRYSEHRSRKRSRSFKVYLIADEGYGRRWTNSGCHGAGCDKAALYSEWGAFIAELFRRDPDAIVGQYSSPENFVDAAWDCWPYGKRNDRPESPYSIEQWINLFHQES